MADTPASSTNSPDHTSVRRSVEVDADPEVVWELVVDDDERSTWFGGESELEIAPGGAGRFTDPDGTRREAVVDDVRPGRRLTWTWWPETGEPAGEPPVDATTVTIDLSPRPGGSRITVTETVIRASAAWDPGRSDAGGAPTFAVTDRLLELEHVLLLRSSPTLALTVR